MSRIRTIKPELFEDEKLGRLSRDTRLLFIALISMADDEGRFRASGAYIRGNRYAYDDDLRAVDVDRWRDELAAAGLVRVYRVAGELYGEVVGWLRHQRVERPSASRIPAPPATSPSAVTENQPLTQDSAQPHRSLTEDSPQPHRALTAPIMDLGPRTLDLGSSPLPPTGADTGTERAALAVVDSPAPLARPDRLAAVVDAWNEAVADSGVRTLRAPSRQTEARDAKLRRALERWPDAEAWRWCARALSLSRHHCGGNDRGWRASLEWLLERGNGAKLEEWMAAGERLRCGEVERTAAAPLRRLTPAEAMIAESQAALDAMRARARASPAVVQLTIDSTAQRLEDR